MEELGLLALALAFTGVLILFAFALRRLGQRLRRADGGIAEDLAKRYALDPGKPGILFLFDNGCNQCSALQEPALATLSARTEVSVRKLAAAEEAELVNRFGIATFPATVVIDRKRRVRGVNIGFVDAETLSAQLH